MDTQKKLRNWQQRLQKLQLELDMSPELRVFLKHAIHVSQDASTVFSETQSVLVQTDRGAPNHQKAFQHLMCVERQRNALWKLMNNVMELCEATFRTDDERAPGGALDAIWDIKVEVADEFARMGEDFDVWIQRKIFNDAIKPYARLLTIFDIPTELWSLVFEQVIGDEDEVNRGLFQDYASDGRNLESIKNIRLTCRRFCDASSHLLLRRVDVALIPGSLARFDRISRHPTFSKSVRAIRIDLSCYPYSDLLAQDEAAFLDATIDEVCGWLHMDKETLQLSEDGHAFFRSQSLPKVQIAEAVHRVGQAVALWRSYLTSGCKSPLLDDNDVAFSANIIDALTAVRGCYQEYRKRFKEQNQRLVRDWAFPRTVAEAMARMPNAVRMLLTDDVRYVESCEGRDFPAGASIVDSARDLKLLVRERMLKPSTTWEQVERDGWAAPPSQFLHLIPVALHQARVPLVHLEVNVSWNHCARWSLSEHDLRSLRALAKTLEVVDYNGPPDFPRIQGSAMRQYLGAFMSGEKLQDIGINFRIERAETMEIGPVLDSLRSGASLRHVRLYRCSLHLDQLQSFLQKFSPKAKSLTLHGVRLLSGTWADALDILRDTVMDPTSVVSVQRPTGAECDNMSRERYNAVFASGVNPDYKNSKANKYISEWGYQDMQNPLRPESVENDASPAGTTSAHGVA